MKLKGLLIMGVFVLAIVSCSSANSNTTSVSTNTSSPITTTNDNITTDKISKYELVGFENDIKTDSVINPGMGFYRTRYISLKRDMEKLDYDFSYNGFYHVRIDLSDFSAASNNDKDYDITTSALNALDEYFTNAKINSTSLIIRFAYDKFDGKADLEPSLDMMKNHIKSLSTVINKHTSLFIAIECGLIGPWGEMHTSILDTQDTYNELFKTWIDSVNDLPILSRKPRYVYKYLGYTLDNLDTFNTSEKIRLGVYNDGYYGTNLDTGTYESLDARKKETVFISKLNNPFGGECIGEPTDYFSYDEIIEEMNLVNLTYLNYEWKDSIINSWKNKEYDNTTFYNYMENHMGFKLYVDDIDISIINDFFTIEIGLSNMGFSNITRDLKANLIIEADSKSYNVKTTLTDTSLKINMGCNLYGSKKAKIYLSISDDLDRSYELMNGKFENKKNYLGEIKIVD